MKGKRDRDGDVDAYLAGVPEDARAALQALRETIRSAAPGAEEGFSYGAQCMNPSAEESRSIALTRAVDAQQADAEYR